MRVWAVLVMCAVVGVGWAQPRREMMGSVRAAGAVDVSMDGTAYEPMTGGPIAEGTTLRTALGGSATVELRNGDVIGVSEGAVLQLQQAVPPRLRLDAGHVLVTLQPTSVTTIDTPVGMVRTPLGTTGAGPRREAAIIVASDETSVRAVRGDLDVLQHGAGLIELEPGQVATFGLGDPEPVVTSVAGTPDDPDATRPNGNPKSDPKIMASPLVAQLVVAVGVITGGVLGGLTGF